jgi:hypothetical protein
MIGQKFLIEFIYRSSREQSATNYLWSATPAKQRISIRIGKTSCLIFTIIVYITASITLNSYAKPQPPSEYQLKSAFLYNFAKFVQWPAESFADDQAPLIFGILGKDPFGKVIDQTIRDKTFKDRELSIKRFEKIEDVAVCHILFISSSEEKHLAKIMAILKDSSILTVGEVKEFAERGGVINFVIVENKIRFEINVEAAERAKLKISSKLLKLAKIVKDERRGEEN